MVDHISNWTVQKVRSGWSNTLKGDGPEINKSMALRVKNGLYFGMTIDGLKNYGLSNYEK